MPPRCRPPDILHGIANTTSALYKFTIQELGIGQKVAKDVLEVEDENPSTISRLRIFVEKKEYLTLLAQGGEPLAQSEIDGILEKAKHTHISA